MAKSKEPRKRTPAGVELIVLEQSRRRCTLCFYLNADLREKHGQIAHLDDDRTNYAEDNLAFLCMEHHSVYDSTTRQHKNYTIYEVKRQRSMLYEAIGQGKHIPAAAMYSPVHPKPEEVRISALQKLHEALIKSHYELNQRTGAGRPKTIEEYRTQVELHDFSFRDALVMTEIYLDKETSEAMHNVLGSVRQMCTAIWLRVPEVLESNGGYVDEPPDWKLFTRSFDVAQRKLKALLNPNQSCAELVGPEDEELPNDGLQVWTASNLDVGDSVITMTNTNATSSLCVNAYIFDVAGGMIACCSCRLASNGLASFSSRNDLISNTLTPAVPRSIVIKLVASSSPIAGTCNPSSVTPATVAPGLRAWGKTYGSAGTPFSLAELSATELKALTTKCGSIQAIGSGFGICRPCRAGAI